MKNNLEKIFLGVTIFIVSLLLSACTESDRPFVVVDGKTYTEHDIKREMPDRYANIRKNYETQIKRALKSLGEEKLYEVVAKDKGFENASAYKRSLEQKIGQIGEAEIKERYDFFRKRGQLQGKPLEEVRNQIVAYIRSEKRRDVIQAEQAKLKVQYGYEEGPVLRMNVDIQGEPTRPGKGKITIVEFSGYECNYCKKVQETTRQLRNKYGDKLKWVLKDYPLRLSSLYAHISSNCVYRQNQGKYWSYFDKLFAQDRKNEFLTKPALDKYVATLGIDMKLYNTCVVDPEVEKEIRADHQEGLASGVRGIPHFFINGRALSGAQPAYAFEEIIREELLR